MKISRQNYRSLNKCLFSNMKYPFEKYWTTLNNTGQYWAIWDNIWQFYITLANIVQYHSISKCFYQYHKSSSNSGKMKLFLNFFIVTVTVTLTLTTLSSSRTSFRSLKMGSIALSEVQKYFCTISGSRDMIKSKLDFRLQKIYVKENLVS